MTDPLRALDRTLSDLIAEGLGSADIATIMADEDFSLDGGERSVVEVVRRRRRQVGGFKITVRKTGRPSPQKSMKAKLTARRFASRRKLAARKFARSARGKQLRRVMARVRTTSSRRRSPARRHGPPRRGRSARTARRRRR